MNSWVRRTLSRPMLCSNCYEQCWAGDSIYLTLEGDVWCEGCPPDEEDDGSIAAWMR